MVTNYHHKGTERTEDSQRTLLFHYPLETARNQNKLRTFADKLPSFTDKLPTFADELRTFGAA